MICQVRCARIPKALRELIAAGTKLTAVPAAGDGGVLRRRPTSSTPRSSAKNAKFKKVYDQWKPFRNEEILWFRVAEDTFDNFMARQSAANKL